MPDHGYLGTIDDPSSVVTAIDGAVRFPRMVRTRLKKYGDDVEAFCGLVAGASSSAVLLDRIRSPAYPAARRVAFLKMFRRAVAPVIDTEMARKLRVPTARLVESYGETFTPIASLRRQFAGLTASDKAALAVLIGEYDDRGQAGYVLTGRFFDWFAARFEGAMTIEGPRGAGPDIELATVLPGYAGAFPCDFVIRRARTRAVLAVGLARYDATRGGAQSYDRTGGNFYKVVTAREHCARSGDRLRILFLADGPGLIHGDTWAAAARLDGDWDGNVRVTTLKLAEQRVTAEWLLRAASE